MDDKQCEKKCACKLNTADPASSSGCIIIYELTVIIILLILTLINSNELIEKVNLLKSAPKETAEE